MQKKFLVTQKTTLGSTLLSFHLKHKAITKVMLRVSGQELNKNILEVTKAVFLFCQYLSRELDVSSSFGNKSFWRLSTVIK